MSGRAGYTVSVYVIDVSPPMETLKADPGDTGEKASRLGYAKEYVARMIEPKIQSGRKTEHVGVVTFGGRTNNQANRAWVAENPHDEEPPYTAVSSDVAIQTAKPKTMEVVVNIAPGGEEGNPISALLVALDMIRTHKHWKAWALEVVLITDGESAFDQDEYDQVMDLLDNLGIKLQVIGIDFQDPDLPVEKDKSRNKRLSEKFWRAFVNQLLDRVSKTSDFEQFLPELKVLDTELLEARKPHPTLVNGTVQSTHLFIGAETIDAEQAIKFPIRHSKATMKATPPSLSKAWKPAVELQAPVGKGTQSSQLRSTLEELQSQALSQHEVPPTAGDMAAMISSDIKRHSLYLIKHMKGAELATQSTQQSQAQSQALSQTQTSAVVEEEEDEFVDKEDLVKAWRFGSSWVPIEDDTFEPLMTQKGVEILGFVPRANIEHYMFIGEVRYMWPDLTSPKAQIQWSSLISALMTTDMVAITRWVLKDQSPPDVGVGIPAQSYPGDGMKLDLMYWIKLPFADDDHKFFFPSLTKLKSVEGKEITEHPYIPTQEQCDLMDRFVLEMDLDTVGQKEKMPKVEKGSDDEEEDEEDEEHEDEYGRWFDPARSYNPVIHRIKEAIFHASITEHAKDTPLPPPHPDLVKYFHTPDELVAKTEKLTERLKDALDIKKVPPRMRKRAAETGFGEDEGFLDIDELFGDAPTPASGVKPELSSPVKPKLEDVKEEVDADFLPPPPKAKPKPGRLISNEQPLVDFKRLIESEGDVFRKAIQDMGSVVRENVAASFSHSAFPLALKCLEEMRATALTYEETETYNDAVDDLEAAVKGAGFKHPDFWNHFEKAGDKVSRISAEEAQEALEEYDE